MENGEVGLGGDGVEWMAEFVARSRQKRKETPSLISSHLASVDVKQQVYLLIKQTTSQKISHLVHVSALHAVPEDGLGVRPSTNHDLVRVMRALIGG